MNSVDQTGFAEPFPVPDGDASRRLQATFRRAVATADRPDADGRMIDSAIAACVAQDPGTTLYVKSFVERIRARSGANATGRMLRRWFGSSKKLRLALERGAWSEFFPSAIDRLSHDPDDAETASLLAEACVAGGAYGSALVLFQHATRSAKDDVEIHRKAARTLGSIGRYDQAILLWRRVESLVAGDPEAGEQISLLTFEKSGKVPDTVKDALKQEGAESSAPTRARAPAKAKKRHAPDAIPQTPLQRLAQHVEEHPEDLAGVFEYVTLLEQERKYDVAERALERALAANGRSLLLLERLENVQMERAHVQYETAAAFVDRENVPAARELAGRLRQNWRRVQLEAFRSRSLREPDRLDWRYEYAWRLKREKLFDAAEEAFRTLVERSPDRCEWMIDRGECLQFMERFEEALASYEDAATNAPPGETRLLAQYRYAVLAVGMERLDAAEKFFDAILAAEPNFKDARERLDNLRQMRQSS
jgi:tetratricopeptide (TPR) repeat protein